MGGEEACLNKKQKKRIQVKRCDIDNGDGTGEINTAKDRESPTEREALAQVRGWLQGQEGRNKTRRTEHGRTQHVQGRGQGKK